MSREGSGGGRAGPVVERVRPSSRKGNNGRRLLSHYSVLVLSAAHTVLRGAWLGQWQCRGFNLGSILEQAGQGTAGRKLGAHGVAIAATVAPGENLLQALRPAPRRCSTAQPRPLSASL